MPQDTLINRHNIHFLGPDAASTSRPTLLLAHGFGCDQQIWGPVAQILAQEYPLVLFDHMGCGQSDISAYDPSRYTHLSGYADDLVDIVQGLKLERPILVGHSVSSAIAWLASLKANDLFRQIIAIGPSPRYINDSPGYVGGFEEHDVQEMIDLMERNHFEWAGYLAPIVMAAGNRPALADELRQTFLNADPVISRRFAQTTFRSDIRDELPKVTVPTLILYCEQDVIVPLEVIDYLNQTLPNCTVKKLDATGHYPHMSNPPEVARAVLEGVEHAI
ncbi:alpha/beta fold hydrolase [Saccharospirillum impatiens]|jgi:sigma-B regulation protein RsbQ|uniref:alpha/beta fold hydrolase n=1 Tax=Saccharospirillum impatiens TaxID=169438 RepID=UPI00048AA922|nr:alpha/beta hydrolase [Saccharospirillum impatiens]